MTSAVTISHTFEAGHRLPFLPGKCESLHGHSWKVEVVVSGERDANGIVVNFTDLKARLRNWIDANLDHGLMLGADDELRAFLATHGKVFAFGPGSPQAEAEALPWPTVENVAELIGRVTAGIIDELELSGDPEVEMVRVDETSVNAALWMPED